MKVPSSEEEPRQKCRNLQTRIFIRTAMNRRDLRKSSCWQEAAEICLERTVLKRAVSWGTENACREANGSRNTRRPSEIPT